MQGRIMVSAPPPKAEEMGGISDVLVVAVASGGTLTALATALNTWIQARRSTLTVKISDDKGREVQVSAEGEVAKLIVEQFGDDDT